MEFIAILIYSFFILSKLGNNNNNNLFPISFSYFVKKKKKKKHSEILKISRTTFFLLDYISNDFSKFSQRSFQYSLWYSLPLLPLQVHLFFFFFFQQYTTSSLVFKDSMVHYSVFLGKKKKKKKKRKERRSGRNKRRSNDRKECVSPRFTKSRLLEGVEYLRRTGWNLIKKILLVGDRQQECRNYFVITFCFACCSSRKKRKKENEKEKE